MSLEIKRGGEKVEADGMEKALQDLTKALKDNDAVERVKIIVTLVKPKSSKAKPESK